MLDFIFGNALTRKVERKKKIEGDVEVLKKQQKVESETLVEENKKKKINFCNSINAQIAGLQANISMLKNQKITQSAQYDQELKVTLDKKFNEFDLKIIAKQNKINRYTNLIDAERKTIEYVMDNTNQPNAPTSKSSRILLETLSKK